MSRICHMYFNIIILLLFLNMQIKNVNAVIPSISAAADHSVALMNDGTVWTWGYNSSGELGDSSYINKNFLYHNSEMRIIKNKQNVM